MNIDPLWFVPNAYEISEVRSGLIETLVLCGIFGLTVFALWLFS